MNKFVAERFYPKADFSTDAKIELAQQNHTVFSAVPYRCDKNATLYFNIDGIEAVMTEAEVSYPTSSYASASACVGRKVCFVVVADTTDNDGNRMLYLSRRAVQKQYCTDVLERMELGTIIPCVITAVESFGAFCDIGCGVSSLIRKDRMSTSRIKDVRDRVREGDEVYAVVSEIDENGRISLSMKELLGTWEENVASFSVGDVVAGIVRGVQDYGVFIELAPNLCGLSENDIGCELSEGDRVSVRISKIIPEKMKIKLFVMTKLPKSEEKAALRYYIKEGVIKEFVYSPKGCARTIKSVF